MNSITDYAVKYKVLKKNNLILEKSLESQKKEDRTIEILTKEISEFIIKIIEKEQA